MAKKYSYFQSNSQQSAANGSTSVTARLRSFSKRSGLEIAGVFICAGVVAAVAVDAANGPTGAKSSSQDKPAQVELQTDKSSDVKSEATVETQAGNSSSINSSTDSQGNVTTKVMVNGEEIKVPENGSTSQTITNPDGSQSTVNVNSSHTSTGTSLNSNVTSTNFNNFSSSVNISGGTSTSTP